MPIRAPKRSPRACGSSSFNWREAGRGALFLNFAGDDGGHFADCLHAANDVRIEATTLLIVWAAVDNSRIATGECGGIAQDNSAMAAHRNFWSDLDSSGIRRFGHDSATHFVCVPSFFYIILKYLTNFLSDMSCHTAIKSINALSCIVYALKKWSADIYSNKNQGLAIMCLFGHDWRI